MQNAKVFDLIAEDNHLAEIRVKMHPDGPICAFDKVGRNLASTFTGLCAEHDSETFKPIDTQPLDITNDEQMFLLAYRSMVRELYAVMDGAQRAQAALNQLVQNGEIAPDQDGPQMQNATLLLMRAYQIYLYKSKRFDLPLAQKRFKNIKHSSFMIENEAPILAASSFFSAKEKPLNREFPAVIMNIVPTSESETTVVFSYAKDHSGDVRKYIAPIILAQGNDRKKLLSKITIDRAENFFLRPSVVQSWPAEKRKFIEDRFVVTAHSNRDDDPFNDHMMLFASA